MAFLNAVYKKTVKERKGVLFLYEKGKFLFE